MRQNVQSTNDAKLRKALENMRYKACTEDDIAFLCSRIASDSLDGPSLRDPKFRDVSIITAWNSQKDRINELGAVRFAADHGQELVSFFSDDKWAESDQSIHHSAKKSKQVAHCSDIIGIEDQKALWELSAHTSDHLPAKLDLCIGMPIMIRHNDATELCITKGQEGIVAGWQVGTGTKGQQVLDTLFVKLVNPPTDVQIEGLPANVVPIPRSTTTVAVHLQNDSIKRVVRQQVNILHNFAMTDYTSQGKTRPYNVVDLQHCGSHQSYYTCLSRSASADGTVIMGSFDRRKITGGASGWLRQEYRMLELLDEISLLRYNGELPDSIQGHRRNTLISLYRQWKGDLYVPSRVPDQVKWSAADPLELDDSLESVEWKILNKKDLKAVFVPAQGSIPLQHATPAKRKEVETEDDRPAKKSKTTKNYDGIVDSTGLKWDAINYSCAYDSLFTILFNLWLASPQRWNKHLKNFTPFTDMLLRGFQKTYHHSATLEDARDAVRKMLTSYNSTTFPTGPVSTSASELAHTMMGTDSDPSAWIRCRECGVKVPINKKMSHTYCPVVDEPMSTSDWLTKKWKSTENTTFKCLSCDTFVQGQWQSDSPPKIIILDVYNQPLSIALTVHARGNKLNTKLHLKGVIYYKCNHFTSIIVDHEGRIKFHDGIQSPSLEDSGVFTSTIDCIDLSNWKDAQACLVVYARSL
ncbi:hypothetical protein BJ138DRAFT_1020204 [Hygrophoropsis aurantiaca]|uniref:Uncharacterized protein n=1 Tax=Hygrophoropsis aurantiaca TaxID=72124 RepID=A0ACB7ZS89_9AGAM|nr:hypothetical protein BJ138DRAFT_1020204 [Hygrophoropsis aurantiaca]